MSYYDGDYVGRHAQRPWDDGHSQGQRQGYDYDYNYQGQYQHHHQQAPYGTYKQHPFTFYRFAFPSNRSNRNNKATATATRLGVVLPEAHPSHFGEPASLCCRVYGIQSGSAVLCVCNSGVHVAFRDNARLFIDVTSFSDPS